MKKLDVTEKEKEENDDSRKKAALDFLARLRAMRKEKEDRRILSPYEGGWQ